MNINEFIPKAKQLVADYTNDRVDVTDKVPNLKPEDVYVVWYAKTLQKCESSSQYSTAGWDVLRSNIQRR